MMRTRPCPQLGCAASNLFSPSFPYLLVYNPRSSSAAWCETVWAEPCSSRELCSFKHTFYLISFSFCLQSTLQVSSVVWDDASRALSDSWAVQLQTCVLPHILLFLSTIHAPGQQLDVRRCEQSPVRPELCCFNIRITSYPSLFVYNPHSRATAWCETMWAKPCPNQGLCSLKHMFNLTSFSFCLQSTLQVNSLVDASKALSVSRAAQLETYV